METAKLERNETETVETTEPVDTVNETSEPAASPVSETETVPFDGFIEKDGKPVYIQHAVPRETETSENLTVDEKFQQDYKKYIEEHGTHEDPTGEIDQSEPAVETESADIEEVQTSVTTKTSFFTQENIGKFLQVALFLTIIAFSLHALYGIFNKPKQTTNP